MISAVSHLLHLSRAGYVFAREGVRAPVALGRVIERPSSQLCSKNGSGRPPAARNPPHR